MARRAGRTAATAAGVALAVALLGSLGSFLSASKATMTSRAVAQVSVDWQVQAQPGADPAAVLETTRSFTGVRAAAPVAMATTPGLEATVGASTQSTGPGVVLGIPDGYAATYSGAVRSLTGAPDGVLVAQQTAANLHVAPGDALSIGRAGLAPAVVTVAGVVDLPQADSLFQVVGAPPGAQPQAPPDNVVVVPQTQWHELFDPLAATRPDQVKYQVHVRLDHRLPSDPNAAYTSVVGRARNLELRLAGTGRVGDNLGATLAAARGDALYAQVLFLFLGLPGAVLAALLTGAVAGVGADRRRREHALLRTRGATTRQLVGLGLAEAAAVGGMGAVGGLGIAAVIGQVSFGTARFGATAVAAAAWGLGAAAVGLVVAGVTVAVPAWRDARNLTVARARSAVGRAERAPLWARLGLDFGLLAGSGAVFWLTGRNGYKLVLAPEGTPSISVNYWALAGPLLLWVGAGLLAWRLADLVLGRGRRLVAVAARPLAGRIASTVAATMSRQRRLLARGVVLVGLTLSFAASTAVFNATYRQQAGVDARLTNGGDVTVTESPGAAVGPSEATRLATVPGVKGVEELQHRFAYVGADLQDLFGVNPTTVAAATKLQDAYFQGGGATQVMRVLANQPDGILVSAETVKDFQLHVGDAVRLRLTDGRGGPLHDVAFRFVGVAKEFPTAPRDSFLVANASYVAQQTGSDAVGAFLIDTGSSSPSTVASRVRSVVGPTAMVSDITTSRRLVGSSLTAVDLSGLTRVELGFALALAAAATGLVLALGLNERRRTFAIAAALGARPRQLGGFVWAEALFVTLGGLAVGVVVGSSLSTMLVKVLTGVFDPPPATLAVPWAYLLAVLAVSGISVAISCVAAVRHARQPAVDAVRDL